jgi:hypothetical protein
MLLDITAVGKGDVDGMSATWVSGEKIWKERDVVGDEGEGAMISRKSSSMALSLTGFEAESSAAVVVAEDEGVVLCSVIYWLVVSPPAAGTSGWVGHLIRRSPPVLGGEWTRTRQKYSNSRGMRLKQLARGGRRLVVEIRWWEESQRMKWAGEEAGLWELMAGFEDWVGGQRPATPW